MNSSDEVRSDYGVALILSGTLDYSIGQRMGKAGEGHLLLLEPSDSSTTSGRNLEVLLLDLSPAFVLDHAVRMHVIAPMSTVSFQDRVLRPDERMIQLGKALVTELLEESPGREMMISAVVEQTLVYLLRSYANMKRSDELELSRVGLVDRRIRRSVELMDAQMEHDLSLKTIAAASFLSPFHFARLFKKLTGTTPHSYLAALRTNQAKLLIAETDLSITEISARVGYASPSHFTKSFRQATGLAPRAFRKALVGKQ